MTNAVDVMPGTCLNLLNASDGAAERTLWHSWMPHAKHIKGICFSQNPVQIIATLLGIRVVEAIQGKLPYTLFAPSNYMAWEDPQILNREINGGLEFLKTLLGELVGVKIGAETLNADDVVILVDPHLMRTEIRKSIASRLMMHPGKVLILLPEGIQVPQELLGVHSKKGNEAFPTSWLDALVEPSATQILIEANPERLVVIGTGERLLPTIFSANDFMLGRVVDTMKFEEMRAYSQTKVAIGDDFCPMEFFIGQPKATFWEYFCELLKSYGAEIEAQAFDKVAPAKVGNKILITPILKS